MTFTDPCDCVMEDRCPRCGQDLRGSWLRHPGRRLGGMLQDGLSTLDWNLRSLVGNAVELAVRAGVPNLRLRNYVMARLSHLLTGPLMRLTAPAWRLSERLNPTRDETPPCDHCGWTGTNPGDVQPPWECLCHADYEAELHAQMAAGACCWRCEQPFDGDRPGVQAKLPIFGVRWQHPGCLFEDERAIEPPATDPTA